MSEPIATPSAVVDAAWWREEAEVCRGEAAQPRGPMVGNRLAGYLDLERVCRERAAAREYGGQRAVRWEQP